MKWILLSRCTEVKAEQGDPKGSPIAARLRFLTSRSKKEMLQSVLTMSVRED